ncbi:ATP-binding protein [Rubrobacter calidifluminis]|uniref:ATP-binding protein n=1 Tax=Rubrobacter calidifluminis TaxID=1392640 RepID=UPI00235EA663|nr:ATP-binding protein [Rubrobacter calidifluminis]
MNRETTRSESRAGRGFSEPVSLKLPSHPEYILLARLVVARIGQLAGFGPEDVYDLKLAVTEAATNVIRHASVDSFEIEYFARPGFVEITVMDEGGGFDVEDLTRSPDGEGGFGLAVIRGLVDEVILNSTPEGTRLKMIRRLQEEGGRRDR